MICMSLSENLSSLSFYQHSISFVVMNNRLRVAYQAARRSLLYRQMLERSKMAVSPRPGRVFTTTGLEETRDRPQSRSPSRGRRPRRRRLRRRRLRREDPITIRDSRNRSANRSDRNPWNTRHHPLLSRLSSFISSSSFSSASIEFSFLLLSSANSIETHFLIRDENPRCDRSYVST